MAEATGDRMNAVDRGARGLRRAIGEAHRRYSRRINFREKWRDYLWQGQFASFVMDERYHARTGRPPGGAPFVDRLEKLVGRVPVPRKPGRKPRFPKQPK